MTLLLCGLESSTQKSCYIYNAEHFWGLCWQVFALAWPALGNMPQVSLPRTQGHIAVTNSEKMVR